MQIAGNSAVVTGGASGLGEITARKLHAAGASVVLFDRDAERGNQIAEELGERAVVVSGDVLDAEDTNNAIQAAGLLAPLRIVVACAGGVSHSERTIKRDGTPHDLEFFQRTVNLNLVGTFNTLRLAAAQMATQEPANEDGERGVIITTASLAGYEGQIGQVAYGSAKAGIIGMTLIAARDLASAGIRVNCIAPGIIGTRAWDGAPEGVREGLEAKVPFPKRLGHPEEFADLAGHLVTNTYLNGNVVRLDGGIRFDPK